MDEARRIHLSIILIFLTAALLLKVYLTGRIPINQDEFNFLSFVHAYERGAPMSVFHTLHVHLFGWLLSISDNEVAQVMMARNVMLFLWAGTCICIFFLGNCFFGIGATLLTILCYISLSFVVFNGAGFRPDTIAAFFSMFALCLFLFRRHSTIANVVAGLAMALSCLFTVKAALHLWLFVPLSFMKLPFSRSSERSLKYIAHFVAAFIMSYFLIHMFHAGTLATAESGQAHGSFLGRAFSTFFTFQEVFPALKYFLLTLRMDWIVWLLLALGLFLCVHDLLRRGNRYNKGASYLLIMFTPLLSVLVYRNAYPYYYAFMMPTVMLLCGYGFCRLLSAISPARRWLSTIVTAVLVFLVFQNSVFICAFLSKKGTEIILTQETLFTEIHKIFPEPVPYIDGCNMIASYPQVGFFMSTAGMRGYLRRGSPNLKELLRRERPLFLVANVPHLDLRRNEPPASSAGLALRQEDWAALRSYFIHHWGSVWVPGKQFNFRCENLRVEFTVMLPGIYTVEADMDILIDSTRFRPGETVWLSVGIHVVEAEKPVGLITLRWGDHLYRPEQEPNSDRLFLGIFG